MALKKGKHAVISVSSSSSDTDDWDEDVDETDSDPEDSDEEYALDDDDDDDFEEDDSSQDHDDGDSADVDDGDGEDSRVKPSDEERCGKVIDLLQRRKSLDMLRLEDCKAYLRKHELRVSGTKATCIVRILEHWRIKDGNAENLYPRSSFSINCTGDVCKGDVILFKQLVYEKFDIVTRGGDIIGKRTIAGRVVKESYGAAKQQHTFTVEILWSKGVKRLPPLYPLLVKGRNLYKLKTFRQRWKNEAERSKVLAEKHRRGAAARHIRAIAKAKSANKGTKRQRNFFDKNAPLKKRRKNSESTTREVKQKKSNGMFPLNNTENQKVLSNRHTRHKQDAKKRLTTGNLKQTNHHNHRPVMDHYHIQRGPHHFHNIAAVQPDMRRFNFPTYNAEHTSTRNEVLQYPQLYRGNDTQHSYGTHASQLQFDPRSSRYPYESYTSQFDPGRSSNQQRQIDFNGRTLPSRIQLHRWRQP